MTISWTHLLACPNPAVIRGMSPPHLFSLPRLPLSNPPRTCCLLVWQNVAGSVTISGAIVEVNGTALTIRYWSELLWLPFMKRCTVQMLRDKSSTTTNPFLVDVAVKARYEKVEMRGVGLSVWILSDVGLIVFSGPNDMELNFRIHEELIATVAEGQCIVLVPHVLKQILSKETNYLSMISRVLKLQVKHGLDVEEYYQLVRAVEATVVGGSLSFIQWDPGGNKLKGTMFKISANIYFLK